MKELRKPKLRTPVMRVSSKTALRTHAELALMLSAAVPEIICEQLLKSSMFGDFNCELIFEVER